MMKIEDLWQSIEKEEEEKNLHFLFGGKLYELHTYYSFVKCIIILNC